MSLYLSPPIMRIYVRVQAVARPFISLLARGLYEKACIRIFAKKNLVSVSWKVNEFAILIYFRNLSMFRDMLAKIVSSVL